jgi:hypothetical protein
MKYKTEAQPYVSSVRAIQWTGSNTKSVIKFINDKTAFIEIEGYSSTTDNLCLDLSFDDVFYIIQTSVSAKKNDYIVIKEKERVCSVDCATFNALFNRV